MRAVILARGLGTRMRRDAPTATLTEEQRRAADLGMKAMVPVGRPFLDYVLSALADAGIMEICLVIGPEHEQIVRYYRETVRLQRIQLDFALQAEPKGTADAVLAAEHCVGTSAFLVLNADNYYPVAAFRQLREYGAPALPGFEREALVREGNIDVERVRHYALLRVSSDGYLEDIVEKPDEPTLELFGAHALISMNLWSFSHQIFEACRRIAPSSRGELELPAAVRYAVRELGERFRVFAMAAGVLDLSSRRDIEIVAERLRGVEVQL